jgi:serine/threonine kinase 16
MLYAMAYGKSPFETNVSEQGDSMALAVLNAVVKFPPSDEGKCV